MGEVDVDVWEEDEEAQARDSQGVLDYSKFIVAPSIPVYSFTHTRKFDVGYWYLCHTYSLPWCYAYHGFHSHTWKKCCPCSQLIANTRIKRR